MPPTTTRASFWAASFSGAPLLGLTLGQAKTYAAIAAVVLFGLAVASWWIMKEIAQKVIAIVIFAGLGLLVWFQRTNLTDCAAQVRQNVGSGTTAECSFLGIDVSVPTRPSN